MSRWRPVGAVALGLGLAAWALFVWSDDRTRLMAPKPDVVVDRKVSLSLPPSALAVPVRIEIATLVDEIERAVPVSWGDLQEMRTVEGGGASRAAVQLTRSRFEGSMVGDTARLAANVAYRARFEVDVPLMPDPTVSCGTGENELAPRLSIELRAPIGLTSDWRLRTETQVGRIAALTDQDRDRCDVSVIGIDVTERVVRGATEFLAAHAAVIDSIVGAVDVRSRFEGWWQAVASPMQLADEIWLDMRPVGIRQGVIHGHDGVVEIHAELEAEPRVVVGARPASERRELPPLGFGTQGQSLDILVEVVGEYETGSQMLTAALRGVSVERAGRSLRIDRLDLSGIGGGRVALEATVAGDVRGRLFLVGSPSFDPATDTVSVPDLAFSVSTRNLLVSGASWVADLGLEALLRDRARWRVDPAVDWAADHLADALNREIAPGVRLEGSVDALRVLEVAAETRGLIVGVAAVARATLHVNERTGGQ